MRLLQSFLLRNDGSQSVIARNEATERSVLIAEGNDLKPAYLSDIALTQERGERSACGTGGELESGIEADSH